MANAGKDNITDCVNYSAGLADWRMFCAVTLPTAGTITSVWTYVRNTDTGHAACHAKGFVYEGNTSGALLGYSDPVAFADNAAAAWTQFPLITPAAVSAGTYWVGTQHENSVGNGLGIYGTNTGYGSFTAWISDYYVGGLAATCGSYGANTDDSLQTYYVEYTPSSAFTGLTVYKNLG